MDHVCQSDLPTAPWRDPAMARLPGMRPLVMTDWLQVDDAFAGQMALRDRLLAQRRRDVLAEGAGSATASAELLDLVLTRLGPGYRRAGGKICRPDGGIVDLQADTPLATAARLVQEDLCLLQRPDGHRFHVLTAAALCFPASWTLAEKLGRPMDVIHAPVADYGPGLAARVQNLFDRLHPDRPLWRQNALVYDDPALYQPRPQDAPRPQTPGCGHYLRSERQSLLKLPQSGAVLFSIHTYLVPLDRLRNDDRAALVARAEQEGRT